MFYVLIQVLILKMITMMVLKNGELQWPKYSLKFLAIIKVHKYFISQILKKKLKGSYRKIHQKDKKVVVKKKDKKNYNMALKGTESVLKRKYWLTKNKLLKKV